MNDVGPVATMVCVSLFHMFCRADGLMQLLQDFAAAYQALTQFECHRAIELFNLLPARHYNTGWVLCQVARAYFELCDYQQVLV